MEKEKKRKEKKEKFPKKKIIIISSTIIILIIIIFFLVMYITPKEEPKKEKKKTKKEPEILEIVEEKKLTIINQDSNKRPIAVMIDNNIGDGLHAGLQESYINYEIIVEGGLTRIMAVYKDKDVSLIGPVRSSRHYFLDYALESDAIYAHYGWSEYAQNDIRMLGVNNINGLYDDLPYWRDNKIAAPHNVFTTIEKLYSYAQVKNYSTTSNNWNLLNYSVDEINLNLPQVETNKKHSDETQTTEQTIPNLLIANSINIPYSYNQSRSYLYDNISKKYFRSMNGRAHIDKTSMQQLNYKNIIIQKVNNRRLDSYGRQDLDTVGQGQGFYITNGYALPINWTKTERNGKTKYTYNDGTEIKVNDGNTFIHIVPTSSNITIE